MVNGKIFTVGEYVLRVPLLAWHGQLHSVPWMHQESCAGEAGISTRASHPPGFQFQSSISVLICCLQVAPLLSCYFSQKTSGFSLEKKDDIFFVKFSVVKKSNSCLDFVLSSWEAQQSLASSQFLQAACLISNGHLRGEEETISRWITFCFPEVPPQPLAQPIHLWHQTVLHPFPKPEVVPTVQLLSHWSRHMVVPPRPVPIVPLPLHGTVCLAELCGWAVPVWIPYPCGCH